MKKQYVIQKIKEHIETNELNRAQSWIAIQAHEQGFVKKTDKEIESAKFNIDDSTKQIEWFKKLLKNPELSA